jgi:GTP cyclohydrolase II
MLNLRAFDRTALSPPMRHNAVDIATSPCSPITTQVRNAVDIPMGGGTTGTFITFTGLAQGAEHFAVRFGTANREAALLVRMHSECITGDLFGSLRCDCGAQLTRSMEMLQERGGILLYLRQEGRGIGLAAKLDAYTLQDRGLDTFAANRALSLPDDARDYACGAAMLQAMGVRKIRLITNNPDKMSQLEQHGIEIVERVSSGTHLTQFNGAYLRAKVEVGGHRLVL